MIWFVDDPVSDTQPTDEQRAAVAEWWEALKARAPIPGVGVLTWTDGDDTVRRLL